MDSAENRSSDRHSNEDRSSDDSPSTDDQSNRVGAETDGDAVSDNNVKSFWVKNHKISLNPIKEQLEKVRQLALNDLEAIKKELESVKAAKKASE